MLLALDSKRARKGSKSDNPNSRPSFRDCTKCHVMMCPLCHWWTAKSEAHKSCPMMPFFLLDSLTKEGNAVLSRESKAKKGGKASPSSRKKHRPDTSRPKGIGRGGWTSLMWDAVATVMESTSHQHIQSILSQLGHKVMFCFFGMMCRVWW